MYQHDPGSGRGVVLDVGGDIGALIVVLGKEPNVEELFIQPVDTPAHRFHTGVHLKEVDGRKERVAVFPEVATGSYQLLDALMAPFALVDAVGGEVITLDLR